VPQFCRHNRFLHRCPICAREAAEAAAPVTKPSRSRPAGATRRSARRPGSAARGSSGLLVRRMAVGPDDGFSSGLTPGLRSSRDAARLADEIAFAAGRLAALETHPPGLYAEAAAAEREHGLWLCFLTAYLCPLEGDEPWSGIRAVARASADGAQPSDPRPPTGPRTSHDPRRGWTTVAAYRGWAARAGSQAAALDGDARWSPERRFARAYERLALRGLTRDARFDFLVCAGRLGLAEVRADALHLGGEVSVGAKRVFGIGDLQLLERRAGALATAAEVPLEALDLGLWSWQRGERAHLGVSDDAADADSRARVAAALGAGD
jgi:hypothetical protein